MFIKPFIRDKLPHLLGLMFILAFLAALLGALGLSWKPIVFLSAVCVLCVVVPLVWEYACKAPFYRKANELEEELDGTRRAALLERPDFWEGAVLWDLMDQSEREMNGKLAAAHRENRDYREYVETWVHEIKTPIATARLALENYPGPLADRMEEALFAIDGYVEQALFYARSGAVERDYLVRAMSLRDAVRRTVGKYARPLIAAGFALELGDWEATVYTDAKWVEFILGQLIVNAIQYHGPNPKLSFSCAILPQAVELTVADNGPGIPKSDLPRIFQKGFTGENGRKLGKRSTGLGLYLVAQLCARLGLNVRALCPETGGTAMVLTFPRGEFHLPGKES